MAGKDGDVAASLPFEFLVLGIPISANAHPRSPSKGRWQERVRASARHGSRMSSPMSGKLQLTLLYFYRVGTIDVDNMIKPVLDALKGTVYEDDIVISQVMARKTKLVDGLQVAGASREVVDAIAAGDDFVLVRVDGPPAHGVMP